MSVKLIGNHKIILFAMADISTTAVHTLVKMCPVVAFAPIGRFVIDIVAVIIVVIVVMI